MAGAMAPVLEGFLGWLIGTFVFYWWHRARHDSNFLWRVCHQIHHSPSRIEVMTAFYKHPLEITADSMIVSALMFSLLGASMAGAAWYNVFAVFGEYFYHSNLRTPHWMGYFLQRPEHHSVHHQLDLHRFNYGDITWWDRLFGTFRETDTFADRCGFPEDHERHLGRMPFVPRPLLIPLRASRDDVLRSPSSRFFSVPSVSRWRISVCFDAQTTHSSSTQHLRDSQEIDGVYPESSLSK